MLGIIRYNQMQKSELEHVILNKITHRALTHLKHGLDQCDDCVKVKKEDAQAILDCVEGIRSFVLGLPL